MEEFIETAIDGSWSSWPYKDSSPRRVIGVDLGSGEGEMVVCTMSADRRLRGVRVTPDMCTEEAKQARIEALLEAWRAVHVRFGG